MRVICCIIKPMSFNNTFLLILYFYVSLLKSKLICKSVTSFMLDCLIAFAAKHDYMPNLMLYEK